MFKSPFLETVKAYLETAVSICFDGCHKIYIAMDDASHDQQIEFGYKPILVKDKKRALKKLYSWFDASCPLKFIQAISDDGRQFTNVIPQFEYDTDEDGE
jgi:hypothetical protein